MYVHPVPVPVGGTVTIPIPTRGTDGAAVTGNTLADGDFAVHINGSTTAATIAAGATTPSTDFASKTGRNQLVIDTSQDSDFAASAVCHVWLSKSIDGVTIEECIGVFVMESASQLAVRQLQETTYATATLTTQTGVSDNTKINLTGIVDAQSANDLFNDWIGLLKDETDGQCYLLRITDFTNTNLLGTISPVHSAVTLPTPASGDKFWLLGPDAQAQVLAVTGAGGASLTEAGGDGDHLTAINLPNQTMDIVGNITGSLSGSVGSVTGAVGSVTGAVGSVTGAVGSVTAGVTLANDAITAAKFDESTAFPLPRTVSATALGNLEDAYDGTGYDVGGIDVSELNAIVDDLLDAGRLDALVDAIKAKTDSLTFTVANVVDANALRIAGVVVVGAGTSGNKWRA